MDPTPILKMNNQGVRLLGEGEYAGAAKLFREAFQALKTDIVTNTAVVAAFDDDELVSSTTSQTIKQPQTPSPSVVSDDNNSEVVRRKRKTDDNNQVKNNNASRKRRRLAYAEQIPTLSSPKSDGNQRSCDDDDDVPNNNNNTQHSDEPLGRPLWIEEPNRNKKKNNKKRSSRSILNMYASSIMYNYGYALHRMGTRMSDGKKKDQFLYETMRVYGKAIILAAKGRSLVVQWISCHNLQQLLTERAAAASKAVTSDDNDVLARKQQILIERKTAILRSMTSRSNASSMHQICLMLLSMLGIGGNEKSDRPAAAA